MRCNGAVPLRRVVDFTARAGADILWTGHYARIVERDGIRLIARGSDAAKDQSYMLATVDPAPARSRRIPARRSRARAARATRQQRPASPSPSAPRARRRASSPGDDYRAFLERQGLAPQPGPIVDEAGHRARAPRRRLALHAGPAARDRAREPRAGLRAPRRSRDEHARRSGRALPSRSRQVHVRGRLYLPVDARRGEAALPLGGRSLAESCARTDGFVLHARRSRPTPSRPGQVAVLYDDDAIVGAGIIVGATG